MSVEQSVERRLTYGFGINKGLSITGFSSFEWLQHRVERESMGPVTVTKREERLVITTDWEPMIECPHWQKGAITIRKGCTACEAEAQR